MLQWERDVSTRSVQMCSTLWCVVFSSHLSTLCLLLIRCEPNHVNEHVSKDEKVHFSSASQSREHPPTPRLVSSTEDISSRLFLPQRIQSGATQWWHGTKRRHLMTHHQLLSVFWLDTAWGLVMWTTSSDSGGTEDRPLTRRSVDRSQAPLWSVLGQDTEPQNDA